MDDHIRLTREWFHTTVATALMERYPDSTVSFESHHDPLNRALELHRAGTAPDIFQTDDLRNADLIRRRLAYRLDGWIKHKQLPHADDFVQPALLSTVDADYFDPTDFDTPLRSRPACRRETRARTGRSNRRSGSSRSP